MGPLPCGPRAQQAAARPTLRSAKRTSMFQGGDGKQHPFWRQSLNEPNPRDRQTHDQEGPQRHQASPSRWLLVGTRPEDLDLSQVPVSLAASFPRPSRAQQTQSVKNAAIRSEFFVLRAADAQRHQPATIRRGIPRSSRLLHRSDFSRRACDSVG